MSALWRPQLQPEEPDGNHAIAPVALSAGSQVREPWEGDGPCQDCGGRNIVWFAPSRIWNLVMGGPEARDDPGGILCPVCFVKRAESVGVRPTGWKLEPEVQEGEAKP